MQVGKSEGNMKSWLWGRMVAFDWKSRVAMLVFVAVAIASMSYCQLGFWPIGVVDDKPVYLMLLLGPLAMGSILFGPLMGALLGLYAGVVVFTHAAFFPLDFYEVYFMSVLNTFVLLTMVGALSGLLFDAITRRYARGAVRAGLIAAACLVVSFAASGLTTANTVVMYGGLERFDRIEWLINSPLGLIAQALLDALLMIVLCLSADAVRQRIEDRGGDRRILAMFRNWMLLVSSTVFMLSSAVIFSCASAQAQAAAEEDMVSEVEYLQNQINAKKAGEDYAPLLEGYIVSLDGYVTILDEAGVIIATDDEASYPVGAPYLPLLGYDDAVESDSASGAEYRAYFFEPFADTGEMILLEAIDENGVQTRQFTFLAAGRCKDGYACVLRTSDMVYRNRFGAMAASTALAIALIAAIAAMATALLNQLVVRRVDDANASLAKITDGDLSERVNIRDSREFASLSNGINATVTALKDTIGEVEQRNAQDLATAKTIQESALPRDFPPFPHIEAFDIYASMKTAKEVGGDFYDFFLIGEGKLGFVMADVSGKGIPAALFMMAARTQLQNYLEAGLPPDEAVNAANHQLCIGNDAGMFVTAWVGVLEYETGTLAYVNAGHNPPILMHGDAQEWVKDVSGMPLGLFDGIPYEAFSRQLVAGDLLYLYTDGVTEAMDAEGRLFGEDRLEGTLRQYADMNPRSVGVGVRRALTDYTKDAEQSDDITMLVLKYGVPPEKRAVMVLPAKRDQLVHVCNFIHEELRRRSAPKSVYNPMDIAAEELFVNVCSYAYPDATPEDPGEARISFEYEANPPALTVQIADDGIAYNPLAKPDAVTPDDIADVPIGGLGILMAKRSVDEMTYERVGGSNVLTFVKRW